MKARNPIWRLLIVEMKVWMAGLFCGPFKSVPPASLNAKDHSIIYKQHLHNLSHWFVIQKRISGESWSIE